MYEAIDDALSRGDLLDAHEMAAEGLASHHDDAGFAFRLTLSLARMGATDRAIRCFSQYRLVDIPETDCAALGARLIKDRAIAAPPETRSLLFQQAAAAYLALYRASGSYFAGVNAATLSLIAGNHNAGRQLARALLDDPEVVARSAYYAAATAAECAVILEQYDRAAILLDAAWQCPDANIGARASTLRQLDLLYRFGGSQWQWIDALVAKLRPPPVIFYCGHRFITSPDESALAAEINKAFEQLDVGIAYGALACGADILCAETIIKRSGELHVVLPFSQDDFLTQSVADGGADWVARFHHCIAAAKTVTLASRSKYVGDPGQFTYGSKFAMGLARVRARHLQGHAIQLAIWDGSDQERLAGTGRDVAEWRAAGGETALIPVVRTTRVTPTPATTKETAKADRRQYSILFADFSGFSKIDEHLLPMFWSRVMACTAAILESHGENILFRNAWGDALFAVIATPLLAADIALRIQAALGELPLAEMGIPEGSGMRIGLHHGSIYAMHDPVIGRTSFIGTEITTAARIEPITPIGEVYVTQAFASMLSLERASPFSCQYVGRMAMAKNYGAMPMYHLSRTDFA